MPATIITPVSISTTIAARNARIVTRQITPLLAIAKVERASLRRVPTATISRQQAHAKSTVQLLAPTGMRLDPTTAMRSNIPNRAFAKTRYAKPNLANQTLTSKVTSVCPIRRCRVVRVALTAPKWRDGMQGNAKTGSALRRRVALDSASIRYTGNVRVRKVTRHVASTAALANLARPSKSVPKARVSTKDAKAMSACKRHMQTKKPSAKTTTPIADRVAKTAIHLRAMPSRAYAMPKAIAKSRHAKKDHTYSTTLVN